jgi:hypothetical protein
MALVPRDGEPHATLNLRGRAEAADLWRNASAKYRAWILLGYASLLLYIPSGIALGMLMTGEGPGAFGWDALVLWGIGSVLTVVFNRLRWREIRHYRVQAGTLDFNPYLDEGGLPFP